ncbi:capsular exopolysaccharide synthesis family protein [Rhodoblastus acidophilus]|uniref:CpsD/CapB family tyrosine-protein kinase n=1 Tax=Rhodoblastus acidophilus TaxID=1074 RepID=UPI0022247F39|nr:CpsD/CapB family tyrosine-protein kinase [Rhodoblastus acidophilus]MCW2285583.1 capsular exopolysaccharide synthesis family protein [Rhodoblastus acidophilus]MCW2334501.1 capsular exopolysaccharide synthesis family protein [Rhodoblastus acidophilus]
MTEVIDLGPRARRRSGRLSVAARGMRADDSRLSPLLGVAGAPAGEAAESIRSIRASLMAAGFARGGSFALVAARIGQGASVLAGNLALAFAQLELKTLLVDANLRRPSLSHLFGLPARRDGLADSLARGQGDAPIVHEVAPHLALAPAGAAPSNPQDLLASKMFARLAAKWAREFDLVIYDAPAALESADAAVIAARAGSAVIAARLDDARFEDVQRVSAGLRAHGCAIAGVVGARWARA